MIDFKSYDEQIEILKARGLAIADEKSAKNILKFNNYYNIVNAYKDVFIQAGVTPEKYIDGVTFEELCALHRFDKKLRITLSNVLIIIERKLKSVIAYEFSKSCPEHQIDYLDIEKYNTELTMNSADNQPVCLAAELVTKLNAELNAAIDHRDEMICHYKSKYDRIPLWVFINKLTFGTISKMYAAFKEQDKALVAKSIKDIIGRNVYANEIQNAIKILVILRNRTAHDQRIYDFSSSPITVNAKNPFLQKYNLKNVQSLFGAIACISVFLTPQRFQELVRDIKSLINELFLSIHSIPTKKILDKMGIPSLLRRGKNC